MLTLAIDAMSGDLGPRTAMQAALRCCARRPDLQLRLVGDVGQLKSFIPDGRLPANMSLHEATEAIAMADDPRAALRRGKQSSMWRALELVRQGEAQACISAGNTGALVAMSRYLLKMRPDIKRPAIGRFMPVAQGRTLMLDLGANAQCTPEQMHQFAVLGSDLMGAQAGTRPRLALLNMGAEAGKGPELLRRAAELIGRDHRLDYRGFIEADAILSGTVDLIVCDGYAGNIALKASEGVARLVRQKFQELIGKPWYRRFLALPLKPALKRWYQSMDPRCYNGALLLGLRKPVIKSHGGADHQAFAQAIELACAQLENRF